MSRPSTIRKLGRQMMETLAHAGLGEKDAALHAGRRAAELLPMSQDVLSGAWYLYQLAQVEAHFGEHESAIKHIEQLLAAPAGFYISAASLRTDPAWDPLRRAIPVSRRWRKRLRAENSEVRQSLGLSPIADL